MGSKLGEQIRTDWDYGVATAGNVKYVIYNPAKALKWSGSMDELGSGIYYHEWTPDAAGTWTVKCYHGATIEAADAAKSFQYSVEIGQEEDIEGKVDTIDTVVDAVKAKTDALPTDPADQSLVEAAITAAHVTTDGKVDVVKGVADAIKLKTDTIVAGGATEANVTAVKAKTDLIGASVALETGGNLAAVKAKTDTIVAGGATEANVDAVETKVDGVKAKTDLIGASVALETGGNLAAVKAKTDLIVPGGATEANVDVVEAKVDTAITKIDAVDTVVDAIKLKTDTIVTGGATEANVTSRASQASLDVVDGIADAIKLKTDVIGASVALEAGGNLAAVKAKTDTIVAGGATETNVTLRATQTSVDAIGAKIDDIRAGTYVVDGLVVTDAGNSSTVFKTNLTEATDNHYNDMLLVFITGTNVGGQARKISDYDGTTKTITVSAALAATPTVGDAFQILPNLASAGGGDATLANQVTILGNIATVDTNVDLLVQRPQCNVGMAASATIIVSDDLIGYGNDYFNKGWKLLVVLNNNNHGSAPEGEIRDITDYDSTTGTFTVDAFSANVEENDYIMVIRDEVLNLKRKTWFSDVSAAIDLPATAANVNLPNIMLPNITGTIVRVYVGIKFRMIENSSASGANAIQGAQNVRIKKSDGNWGVDDVAAINLIDNQWTVAASTREGGDVQIGDNEVASEIDVFNATYNLRFENADVDYDVLRLNDVQVFLIVEWY
jgi:hypothetical protein